MDKETIELVISVKEDELYNLTKELTDTTDRITMEIQKRAEEITKLENKIEEIKGG